VADPLVPNETFRVEVRVTDVRLDDDTNPNNTVGNKFGVFAAYPDIWWDQSSAFTVPTLPLPVTGRPFALDLNPSTEAEVLPDGWMEGQPAPAIFAVPVSFRNGDFANPPLPAAEYAFSTGPNIDATTPGLVNDTGAASLSQQPTGKQPVFLLDVKLKVESIIGEPDDAATPEDTPITINVLSNDMLNAGQKIIHVGAPGARNGAGTGTETLVYGFTGFDSQGPRPDGEGFAVPEDRHELIDVAVFIENNGVLSIDSFTQPAEGKGTVQRVGDQFRFTPTKDVATVETDTFTYTLTDGNGNFKTVEVLVTIEPVDAAPQITAPASIVMDEDTTFNFTAGSTVSVVETDGQDLEVELVADSSITIAAGSGVTATDPDGSDGTLAFTGTQAQVNAALAGLTFTPEANFFGAKSLEITVRDLAEDDTPIHEVVHTVAIDVQPINDFPVVTVPGPQLVAFDDQPLVFSVANTNEISVDDPLDRLYAPGGDFGVQVTFNVNNNDGVSDSGDLSLVNGAGLLIMGTGTSTLVVQGTTAQINTALAAGLEFYNAPVGQFTMQVILDDRGNVDKNDSGLIVNDTIAIQVVPPARPFAASDQYAVPEDSGGTSLTVLDNDFNFDSVIGGQDLNIISVTQPANGMVVNNGASVTFTPNDDFAGSTTFQYTVEDTQNAGDGPSTATVTVTVNQVNDAPNFTAEDPAAVLEDVGPVSVPGWVTNFDPGAPFEAGQSVLAYHVSNVTNPGLFAVAPAVAPNGTLSYTPADDAFGTATFQVNVQDDGGTANGGEDTSQEVQTFTITVDPVNAEPSFTAVNPPAVNEDAGPQTVNNWASNFVAGPANEVAVQNLVGYTVSEISDPSLFATPPAVDNNGQLTYTPADDAFGTSTFKVTAQDDGGTVNGGDDKYEEVFTITVNPVNDQPDFTAGAIPAITEDDPPVTIPNWITSFDPGPANENGQMVQQYIVVVTGNAGLFAQAPAVSNSGTLTYAINSEASGQATFTVAVRDNGGTLNGGVNTSETQEFTVDVQSENDAPINLLDGIANFAAPSNTQSTDDGVALAFNAANGNLLQVTDIDDDGSAAYSLDLSVIGGVAKGTLSLGPNVPAGLTMVTGNDTASIHLEGTRADINTAINGLTFQPADGLENDDVLVEMATNDGGTSGEVGGEQTDTDTITIAVAPLNDPPIAQDDLITTAEGSSVQFNVMDDNGNGADSPGPNEGFQEIHILSFNTAGTIGTVTLLDADTGEFRYTPPNPDFFGTTTFTYTIQDNGQSRIDGVIQDDFKTDSATVTITVTEVNDAPIARDDLLLMQPNQGNPGQEVRFSVTEVLANDSPGPANEAGQQLRVIAVGNSEKGATVTIDDKGTANPLDDEIVYTVPAGFDHLDRIEVTISDNGTTDGELDEKTDVSIAEIRDVVRTRVSGYAFVDADQQRDRDLGEFGLGGIRVSLSGFDISGQRVQMTTLTRHDGYYEFADVMPNGAQPYTLEQQQPQGWLGGSAVPGNSGGQADGADRMTFTLPVTGVGNDPSNSVAANYNFTEWGLMAAYASNPVADLLHSGPYGGQSASDNAIVYFADSSGELEWFIDVGGWTDYVPGEQDAADSNRYLLPTNGLGTRLTNTRTDTEHDVTWANQNFYTFFRSGAMLGRILGSAAENGLPSNELGSGGEGEGFDAYVAAVDEIFGEDNLD
jgi:hypothetical protein